VTHEREWQFGTHRAHLEEPDIIRVTFKGPMEFDDARALLGIYREVCPERPRYLFADIGASSMNAATRKYLGTELRTEWFLGVVYVGANLLLRIISDALTSHVLFSNRQRELDVRFVATEAEGRAVLETMRRERQARQTNG
jgi:hypothetical protein